MNKLKIATTASVLLLTASVGCASSAGEEERVRGAVTESLVGPAAMGSTLSFIDSDGDNPKVAGCLSLYVGGTCSGAAEIYDVQDNCITDPAKGGSDHTLSEAYTGKSNATGGLTTCAANACCVEQEVYRYDCHVVCGTGNPPAPDLGAKCVSDHLCPGGRLVSRCKCSA